MSAAPVPVEAEPNPSPHGQPAEPAIGAKADPARNLLRLRFAGRVSGTEMHAALARIEALLSELTLEFAVLSDRTRLKAMGPE